MVWHGFDLWMQNRMEDEAFHICRLRRADDHPADSRLIRTDIGRDVVYSRDIPDGTFQVRRIKQIAYDHIFNPKRFEPDDIIRVARKRAYRFSVLGERLNNCPTGFSS